MDRGRDDAPTDVTDPWGRWGPAIRLVIVAAAVGVSIWLIVSLSGIVMQVLVALVLATGIAPLASRLHRFGVPRAVSVLFTYAAFLALLVGLGMLIVPPLVRQVEAMIQEAPRYADIATERFDSLREQFPFLPALDEQAGQALRRLSEQLGEVASHALAAVDLVIGALGGLLTVVLVLLLALYFVMYHDDIQQYLLSFVDPARRRRMQSVAARMGERMGRWVLGQLALSATVGVVTFIGLTIIGVPGALLLAVIAALGEVVPVIGPIVAGVPAVVVATTQSFGKGIAALVFYLVLQQVESYVLAPNIIGKAVKLNPLVVLLALVVGAALYGAVGAIVAVPVTAAASVVLDELRDESRTGKPAPSSNGEQPAEQPAPAPAGADA